MLYVDPMTQLSPPFGNVTVIPNGSAVRVKLLVDIPKTDGLSTDVTLIRFAVPATASVAIVHD